MMKNSYRFVTAYKGSPYRVGDEPYWFTCQPWEMAEILADAWHTATDNGVLSISGTLELIEPMMSGHYDEVHSQFGGTTCADFVGLETGSRLVSFRIGVC